jgi:hypothetical protein
MLPCDVFGLDNIVETVIVLRERLLRDAMLPRSIYDSRWLHFYCLMAGYESVDPVLADIRDIPVDGGQGLCKVVYFLPRQRLKSALSFDNIVNKVIFLHDR